MFTCRRICSQTKDSVAFYECVFLLHAGSKQELSSAGSACHKDFVAQSQRSIDHQELHALTLQFFLCLLLLDLVIYFANVWNGTEMEQRFFKIVIYTVFPRSCSIKTFLLMHQLLWTWILQCFDKNLSNIWNKTNVTITRRWNQRNLFYINLAKLFRLE